MSMLPPVNPPDDFESTVLLRSLLTSLPSIAPPETFETQVLRSARRPSWTIKIVAAVAGTILVVSSFYIVNNEPKLVVVKPKAAVDATQSVDLYNLAPVAVTQDTRYKDLPPAVIYRLAAKIKAKPIMRAPYGVAGY